MRFEVFDEKKKKDPVTRLKLVQFGDGVGLVVVDEDGRKIMGGYILSITSEGMVKLPRCVSNVFGLQRDDCGRVMVKGEYE